jgi:hypothetical protein
MLEIFTVLFCVRWANKNVPLIKIGKNGLVKIIEMEGRHSPLYFR